jgi:hypothetical protein
MLVRRRHLLALVSALFSVGTIGLAAVIEPATISSDGRHLEVANGEQRARVSLIGHVDAQTDFESRELYRSETDNGLHLLVRVVGRSRANDGSGQCGAGREFNLVYLRLDHQLEPLEIQSALIHSCWQNRSDELWLELREIGQIFEVAFQESDSVTYLQFDKERMSRGLETVRFSVPRNRLAPFVSFMPPGEVRVLEARLDVPLRVHPSRDAEPATGSPIRKNTRFRFGRSVVSAVAPGRLRVVADTTIDGMHYGSLRLLTREDYYHPSQQYRGEGYSLVRFDREVYEVDELDDSFEWASPAISEWWAEVIDDDGLPLGWALIDDDAVR